MKRKFSRYWKKSKQPRKQRKYRHNAPLHIKHKFLAAHLSKELKNKYERRAIPLRKDDKVKVMRGQFKGKIGKIRSVNLKKSRVYIEGVEIIKKEGSKVFCPINASNLMILELNLDDKKRKEILERE